LFGGGHDPLQFLVEHLVAAGAVDVGMGLGEEERQEEAEVTIEDFLPGAVPIGRSWISPALRHNTSHPTALALPPPAIPTVPRLSPRRLPVGGAGSSKLRVYRSATRRGASVGRRDGGSVWLREISHAGMRGPGRLHLPFEGNTKPKQTPG